MDCNEYATEILVAQRLAELREQSARVALVTGHRTTRPKLSRRIGVTLVRLGHRLAQGHSTSTPNAGVRLAR